jgi:hypothetical protein
MRSRLTLAAAAILALGVTVGAALYLGAEDEDTHPAIHEMQISKTYQRELLRFGGRASVMFDDFNRWFAAQWRGRRLGVTIGVLSAFVSLGVYGVARRF